MTSLPSTGFDDEAALDAYLSQPTPDLTKALARISGDLVILGIAGKMGVSLGMLAARTLRAIGSRSRIIGVSRFSDVAARAALEEAGVHTIACDLLDPDAVAQLPPSQNVIYLAGRKFGTSAGGEALTWAMNAIAPANVARHYRSARIVALSTGCVYPMVTADSGGCDESVAPEPLGEYAMSALARERIFEYAAQSEQTPVCLVRLNYALDLRYGVIHDIAQQLLAGEAVEHGVAAFNGIWQGDANRMILRCLALCTAPATTINLTGPETLTVAQVAKQLANQFECPLTLRGTPAPRQWLSDGSLALSQFGYPSITPRQVIAWTGQWLQRGGRSLGKPTHFASSDGKF
jgi:nucleoside-diphosphate-sugar epimerase